MNNAPATTAAEIAESIEIAAEEIGAEIAHGNGGSRLADAPARYTLGAVKGDRAILVAALGREPTAAEVALLLAAIPAAVGEAFSAMAPGCDA